MDLPPISLHASTQANNFTAAKVKFLGDIGFKRAVLARELSLDQIREISENSTIELEAFVHGSLCVCLSGQCYMSHLNGGRSANRGACAQPCRKKYTLTDATGKIIVRDKHLLSLKDLNRSRSVRELAIAGVRSFKIEGRMKNIDYVKNITAFYRKELDLVLDGQSDFLPATPGKTIFYFQPDPVKTFHRDATDYFLRGRTERVAGLDSPKSLGEEIGEVTGITRDSIRISGTKQISNNDGLTFIGRNGESFGLKVNKADDRTIYPDKMNGVYSGAKLYRNYDHLFQAALGRKTAERKIPVSFFLVETGTGFRLRSDSGSDFEIIIPKVPANDPEKSRENILRQLARSGETPYNVTVTNTGGNEKYFFTQQQLNELRRGLLEKIAAQGLAAFPETVPPDAPEVSKTPINYRANTTPFPEDTWHFENNITNRLAVQFYRRHGLENPEMGVEKRTVSGRLQVMITRHCIQYELGFCKRYGGTFPEGMTEPFFLKDGDNQFAIEFDCKNCMMRIFNGETSPRKLY
jgi:putative protease